MPHPGYRIGAADLMAIGDAAHVLDSMRQFYVDRPDEQMAIARRVEALHLIIARASAQDAARLHGTCEEIAP